MANTKVTGELIADNAIKAVHIDETATGITLADLSVTGNVGIGASPSSKLTVFESGASGIAIADISGGSSGAGVLQLSAGKVLGTSSFDLIQNSAGAFINQRDNNPLAFFVNGSERMRIDSSGNVGIGAAGITAVGNYKVLELNGSATNGGYLRLSSSGVEQGFVASNSSGILIFSNGATNQTFYTNGSERMRIDSSGRVGVGTTNPTEKLEVNGVNLSNSFQAKSFANIAAGTPYTGTIPYGISKADISSPCDNNWRTVLSNVDFNKTIMWVSLGDAVSKDMATYFISATFPAYGVASFSNTEYVDGGWNTGGFEFSLSGTGGNYSILVRATSYYSSGNTAFGSIYFLRLE